MATLFSLPDELLVLLLSGMTGTDVARISQTCSHLRDVASVEEVWQRRCEAEYGVSKITSEHDVTYYELYSKILFRFGGLLGVWQPDVGPYGGLVLVQFVGDHLEGVQCDPPTSPHLERPVRIRTLFSVELDADHQPKLVCHGGHFGTHSSEIRLFKSESDVFYTKCLEPNRHRHPQGKEAEFAEWLIRETDNSLQNFLFQSQELLLMKYLITSQFETMSNYSRLHLPATSQSVFQVIRPGVFKGGYGPHGIELLSLSYDSDKRIIIHKLSGDPNVPAGQVSVKVDLKRPMILTDQQQQASVRMLAEMDTADLPPGETLEKLSPQRFHMPPDCRMQTDVTPPTTCRARFHSQGQIAGQGFSSPSFIPGHFIVFDDDAFGHIWLSLQTFSLFLRIAEDLSQWSSARVLVPQPDS